MLYTYQSEHINSIETTKNFECNIFYRLVSPNLLLHNSIVYYPSSRVITDDYALLMPLKNYLQKEET